MEKKKIYVGLPYTGMEEESFKVANKATAMLMKMGNIVFSPISQNHPVAMQEEMPTEWDFWESFDTEFLKWCDALYAIKIPGWEKSTGLTAERKIAAELGKEIVFMEPDETGNLTICTG